MNVLFHNLLYITSMASKMHREKQRTIIMKNINLVDGFDAFACF